MEKTIIFTGGGTAGHVFPALAVAEELRKLLPCTMLWVGSKKGMERQFVMEAGIPFLSIPVGKMRRYFSLRNFIDLFNIAAGIVKSFMLCRKYKPALVFSKGGYVSVPLVFAAGRRGVPIVTHESDVDPGLATRINSRYAGRVCLAFNETKHYFNDSVREKLVVTGNPVRSSILSGSRERGRDILGVPEDKKVVFIIGGSQGARQINELIRRISPFLRERYFVIHQMGKRHYAPSEGPMYRTFAFIGKEMFDYLAAADCVVCRAGANTLAEISILGKAAILIPLSGGAGRGDQVKNASLFLEKGAALVLEGERANPEELKNSLVWILENNKNRETLERNMKKQADRNAGKNVAEVIIELIGKN